MTLSMLCCYQQGWHSFHHCSPQFLV
jgi:hypothetical protein